MAEDFFISTSGGGMSMGVDVSSGSSKEKCANKGAVDSLCLALNWRTAAREVQKSSRRGKKVSIVAMEITQIIRMISVQRLEFWE